MYKQRINRIENHAKHMQKIPNKCKAKRQKVYYLPMRLNERLDLSGVQISLNVK